MNCTVDARRDLDALGILLYQMLVGELPSAAAGDAGWKHPHFTVQPRPPSAVLAGVPRAVDDVVLKLLAKHPEDRYQTASALERDLRHCASEWAHEQDSSPVAPDVRQGPGRLPMPERLYGREAEIRALHAAYERVSRQGRPHLVLVSGSSGIGKSSLVNEWRATISCLGGIDAAGKFDQYKREIPYSTLAQALQGLFLQLRDKGQTELAHWRDALVRAMGPNGRLMVDLVPELVHIVGAQPPVPELPPQDAQVRFESVLRRVLGVFARPQHPLALFLDDLQWLDAATLGLLQRLVTEPDAQPLLLIAAYRDNEVGPSFPLSHPLSHPLARMLEVLREKAIPVEHIALPPLSADDLTRLLVDAMQATWSEARPLAEQVFEKTAGNPFFARAFIATMVANGVIARERGTARWTARLDRMGARGSADDVVGFTLARLAGLPRVTQQALSLMACLGDSADAATLLMVAMLEEGELQQALANAVREGLIARHGNGWAFAHDRVQEAAYALIPEGDRPRVHLRIGRTLAAHTSRTGIEHSIFEIVGQLNRGAALIDAPGERSRLAQLNLFAGMRAKGSTAYASALVYLDAGRAMLGAECWTLEYRTAFDLELHKAECEFLTGSSPAAEQRLLHLTARSQSLPDRVAATRLRMVIFTTMDQPGRAVDVGLECLNAQGGEWTRNPAPSDIQKEFDRLWSLLGERSIEELIALPLMTDADRRATMDLLVEMVPTAMVASHRNLVDLALLRMATLGVEHGHCDGSAYAFASLNIVLGFRFGDYRSALKFGELGCELIERRGLQRFKTGAFANFGIFVVPWTQPMAVGSAMIRRGFDTALATGNVAYTIYCSGSLVAHLLISGTSLDDLHREALLSLGFAQRAGFGQFVRCSLGELRLIQDLRGFPHDEAFAEDAARGADAFEQDLQDGGQPTAFAAAICWVRKMQRCFFAGATQEGVAAAKQVGAYFEAAPYILHVGDYHFYAALLRAAAIDLAGTDERAEHIKALRLHQRQIAIWALSCPENSGNRACLVAAEMARLEGRELDAERLYEDAIRSARAHGFVQNEAIAHELAARFFGARGYALIARAYLQQAHALYLAWGAKGKARRLEEQHPWLCRMADAEVGAGAPAPLEHAAMVGLARALSGEMVFGRLVQKLMTVALEQGGAGRGVLILQRQDTLQVVAEATASGGRCDVVPLQAAVGPGELPESMLNHVCSTHRHAVIDDGSVGGSFADDEYLRLHGIRSALCLPILDQQQFTGALYLECRQSSHVFSPNRIALLEMLAAQAAISLENARRFAELQARLEAANAPAGP